MIAVLCLLVMIAVLLVRAALEDIQSLPAERRRKRAAFYLAICLGAFFLYVGLQGVPGGFLPGVDKWAHGVPIVRIGNNFSVNVTWSWGPYEPLDPADYQPVDLGPVPEHPFRP